jgi:hypothetical protein
MLSSRDAVRCTVHDGAMWIHLDNVSIKIPPQLLSKSDVLMDALSVAEPSVTQHVTLAAPKEWLQAWALSNCHDEGSLSGKDIEELVNCLLVCFLRLERSFRRDQNCCSCSHCVHSLSTSRLNKSSLPESMKLILVSSMLGSYQIRSTCTACKCTHGRGMNACTRIK